MTQQKHFVRLDMYEPEDAKFLWKPYIPQGFVTIIEGDPSLGKTYAAMSIAASISTGRSLPGTKERKCGKVLIMSAEDDPRITLRPRIDGLGGNPKKIFYAEEFFTFDDNGLDILERNIRRIKPLLIVIDPIVAYMGSDVDMNRANETRPLFKKLGDIASEYSCSILLVRHLTKASKEKSIYRGLGSIDMIAAVRSAILVDKDLDDPKNIRAVMHHKHNLSERGQTLLYRITSSDKRPGSKFEWLGTASYDVDEHHRQQQRSPGPSGEKGKGAEALLKRILAEGPVAANKLFLAGKDEGFSQKTLRRAKKKLSVKATKKADGWWWELP